MSTIADKHVFGVARSVHAESGCLSTAIGAMRSLSSERRRFRGNVHYAAPHAIRIATPDRHATRMDRHERSAGAGHSHLVNARHVGHVAVRREHRLLRHPVDLKARRFQALGDVGADRRLAPVDRLAGFDYLRIITPIRDDLLDIFAVRRRLSPFDISLQNLRTCSCRVKSRLSASPAAQYA